MKMDPISRKKTSVSPYNKKETPEYPPPETSAPDPISKPITGNTLLAPEPPESFTDVETVDRRVEALIDYLEQWVKAGNLNMRAIPDYIGNNS